MKIPAYLCVLGCLWLRFYLYVNGDSSATESHLLGAETVRKTFQSLKKKNCSLQRNSGVAIGNMAASETDLDLAEQNASEPFNQNMTREAMTKELDDTEIADKPQTGSSNEELDIPRSGSTSTIVVWVLLGLLLGLITVSVLVTQYARQRRKRHSLHLNELRERNNLEPTVQFELLRRTSGASQDGAP